jgi:hypothetical protein
MFFLASIFSFNLFSADLSSKIAPYLYLLSAEVLISRSNFYPKESNQEEYMLRNNCCEKTNIYNPRTKQYEPCSVSINKDIPFFLYNQCEAVNLKQIYAEENVRVSLLLNLVNNILYAYAPSDEKNKDCVLKKVGTCSVNIKEPDLFIDLGYHSNKKIPLKYGSTGLVINNTELLLEDDKNTFKLKKDIVFEYNSISPTDIIKKYSIILFENLTFYKNCENKSEDKTVFSCFFEEDGGKVFTYEILNGNMAKLYITGFCKLN